MTLIGPSRERSSKSLCATWLRGTFRGVSPKHLRRYLDEFVYRFDRRWREGELFRFVLRRVAGGQPLPYHLLVAEGTA